MSLAFPVLSVFFFVLTGYYGTSYYVLGSAHPPTEDYPVAYWRRIFQMGLLAALVLGVYSALTYALPTYGLSQTFLALLTGGLLSLVSYGIGIRLARQHMHWFSTAHFVARLTEWVVSPFHWAVEPFLKGSSAELHASSLAIQGHEEPLEAQMMMNALDFKEVRVRDCMIPRTEITAVSLDDDLDTLREAFINSGHSKVVVYGESIDDVVGYCHSLAIFRKPKKISDILTSILIVPESMPANDLLLRFLAERRSLALVVDEFGGTSGLVSVEDIVEQIFGEIQDEYDTTEDWIERQLDPNTYLLSARHEIDYLNEKYGWRLPEGDYDTLAGLLIQVHEDLPQTNDIITLPPYVFQVVTMQERRIELVRLTIE
jgi:CBS domain containing-hemolysin-like protein